MRRLVSGFLSALLGIGGVGLLVGLSICTGSSPVDAQVVDPRRGDDWTHLRTVNLGPKAGNGIWGNNAVVEEKGNRAFIGNLGSISVVDLQLNVVTGTIGEFRSGTESSGIQGMSSVSL